MFVFSIIPLYSLSRRNNGSCTKKTLWNHLIRIRELNPNKVFFNLLFFKFSIFGMNKKKGAVVHVCLIFIFCISDKYYISHWSNVLKNIQICKMVLRKICCHSNRFKCKSCHKKILQWQKYHFQDHSKCILVVQPFQSDCKV